MITQVRVWDKFNGCFWYSKDYESKLKFYQAMSALEDGGNKLDDEEVYSNRDDKQGNELYLGDIVKWNEDGFYYSRSNSYEQHETVGVVAFEKGEFVRAKIKSLTKRKSLNEGKSVGLRTLIKNDLTRIGNVHESIELIGVVA